MLSATTPLAYMDLSLERVKMISETRLIMTDLSFFSKLIYFCSDDGLSAPLQIFRHITHWIELVMIVSLHFVLFILVTLGCDKIYPLHGTQEIHENRIDF